MVEFLPGTGRSAGAQVGFGDLSIRWRSTLGGGFSGARRALTTQAGSFGTDEGVAHSQMLSRRNQNRQGKEQNRPWFVGMPRVEPTKIIRRARVLPGLYPKVAIGSARGGLL